VPALVLLGPFGSLIPMKGDSFIGGKFQTPFSRLRSSSFVGSERLNPERR
jgi:hypothetical protein